MIARMKLNTTNNQPYFKSAVAFFFLFFLHVTSIGNGLQGISYNVSGLCEGGAFNHLYNAAFG